MAAFLGRSLGSTQTGKISVRNVTVRFPAKARRPTGTSGRLIAALDGVNLTIQPGEFLSLLGPSGCGKSTLLNVMAGFLRPTSGEIEIDGIPVFEPSASRPVVFQNHSLFPWMTVVENVAFGLRNTGRSRPQESALRQLEHVGLRSQADHYPAQLSGGMQQRVGLARALALEPPVLLLDEPFGALDAQTRLLMQEQLLRLWEKQGQTVVFVTHDIDEAIYLSDRIVVLGIHPNSPRGDFAIPLPRPRHPHIRHSPAYREIYENLFHLIRVESLKSFSSGEAFPAGTSPA